MPRNFPTTVSVFEPRFLAAAEYFLKQFYYIWWILNKLVYIIILLYVNVIYLLPSKIKRFTTRDIFIYWWEFYHVLKKDLETIPFKGWKINLFFCFSVLHGDVILLPTIVFELAGSKINLGWTTGAQHTFSYRKTF